jgi:glycosyltransferase involved in cell wall biosynthesis
MSNTSYPTVSLICTVRDEAENIAALLDSMLAQSRLPDEIVINDCQSRDATAAIVASYAAREPRIRLVTGGYNISSGRNNAIAAATGDIIASTDAGLVLDPDWLKTIVPPLEAGGADLVGGFFRPTPQSLFEIALGATNYRELQDIDAQQFLPFGKSMAFRREVWERVGGFPEWASHCEDLVFALAAEQAGYRRVFVPQALVYFRPRSSLWAFARQYFFYARGDGVANLWAKRHAIRYLTYTTLGALLGVGYRQGARVRVLIALSLLVGGIAYTRAPYRRLWAASTSLALGKRIYVLSLVPIIRLVGDIAKMIGYPVGSIQRFKRKNKDYNPSCKKRENWVS